MKTKKDKSKKTDVTVQVKCMQIKVKKGKV